MFQEFLFQDFYKDSEQILVKSLEISNKLNDLKEEVGNFEFLGYAYIKFNLHSEKEMIRVPHREIITEDEINYDLSKLEFGNKKQINLLQHLEYFYLAREYYNFKSS